MNGHQADSMLIGQQFPASPRDIIYEQIRRVLQSHSRGVVAAEEMAGLLALVEPWKDENYYEDLGRIKESDDGDIFWENLEAVVKLLSRKNMWASAPRTVMEGKEFAEALKWETLRKPWVPTIGDGPIPGVIAGRRPRLPTLADITAGSI